MLLEPRSRVRQIDAASTLISNPEPCYRRETGSCRWEPDATQSPPQFRRGRYLTNQPSLEPLWGFAKEAKWTTLFCRRPFRSTAQGYQPRCSHQLRYPQCQFAMSQMKLGQFPCHQALAYIMAAHSCQSIPSFLSILRSNPTYSRSLATQTPRS
jgi:hypothetical protein